MNTRAIYGERAGLAQAADLGVLGVRRENGLTIHQTGNDDYFQITAASSGLLELEILFSHALGDLDLRLLDSSGQQLRISNSVDNMERISFTINQGEIYYIHVFGFNGATNSRYDLIVTAPVNDTAPPVINCPPDIVVECADPAGAAVQFQVAAVDACDPNPQVQCTPPPGSVFPIGTQTVGCTARDSSNNTSSCTFTVTIRDTNTPTTGCPNDHNVECTSPQGAVVNFAVSAADACDPAPIVNANPASGSVFPLGCTPVSVQVQDMSGNTTDCSFNVCVQDTTPPMIMCPVAPFEVCGSPQSALPSLIPPVVDLCDPNPQVTCQILPGVDVSTRIVSCTATDSSGNTSSCTFPINLVEPLEIVTSTLPAGLTRRGYRAEIEIQGGVPPYSCSIINGQLPLELSLQSDGTRCLISGSIFVEGSSEFLIEICDSCSAPTCSRKQLSILSRRFLLVTTQMDQQPCTNSPGVENHLHSLSVVHSQDLAEELREPILIEEVTYRSVLGSNLTILGEAVLFADMNANCLIDDGELVGKGIAQGDSLVVNGDEGNAIDISRSVDLILTTQRSTQNQKAGLSTAGLVPFSFLLVVWWIVVCLPLRRFRRSVAVLLVPLALSFALLGTINGCGGGGDGPMPALTVEVGIVNSQDFKARGAVSGLPVQLDLPSPRAK